MSKSYSVKKVELLVIVDGLVQRVGSELLMKMVKLEQQNSYMMFSSKISIDATYCLLRKIPRDYDNPEGIQRALKESKVNNIIKIALEDPQRYSSPNAVVLALFNSCEFVSFEFNPNDSDIAYYKVDLKTLREKIEESEVDSEGYLKEESDIFPGILIDGHHRTTGLFEAGKLSFECPTTVYIDIPYKDTAKVFSDINVYQEKPSAVHSMAMKAIAGTLSNTEEMAHSIITLLNGENWSILSQRVKDTDGKRPKDLPKPYVTNSTFIKLLESYVLDYLPQAFSIPQKARILNDYFKAWAEVYPKAWTDEKTHVLVKSMGFQIMLRLFREIFTRTSLSQIPTTHEFKEFLIQNLNPNQFISVHGKDLPLNWNSPDYGGFSSGKGINDITTALTRHIANMNFALQGN